MAQQHILIASSAPDAPGIHADLAESGFAAIHLTAPETAIENIRSLLPNLLLLSIASRPDAELSSLSLLSRICGQFPQLPVVVVASELDTPTVPEHLAAGAVDFIYYAGVQKELLTTVVKRNLAQGRLDHLEGESSIAYSMLEQDQKSGFRVQQAMMPNSPMSFQGLTFNHQLYPSMIMSGDFIDYFELPDGRAAFYIADVSGHGASCAFITVLLKSLSRRLAQELVAQGSTTDVLHWFNAELLQWQLDHHVTMFFGIIDQENRMLEYSNAAHFPGTILCQEAGARFLKIGGQPLGLYVNPNYENHSINLPSAYSVVMFSDGVFEIMPQASLEAKEAELLATVSHRQHDLDALVDELGVLAADTLPDDIAVFTVASV